MANICSIFSLLAIVSRTQNSNLQSNERATSKRYLNIKILLSDFFSPFVVLKTFLLAKLERAERYAGAKEWCERFGCKINDEKQTFCCKFRKQLFPFFHSIYAYSIILRAYKASKVFPRFFPIFFAKKYINMLDDPNTTCTKFYLIFITTRRVFLFSLFVFSMRTFTFSTPAKSSS